LFAVCEMLFFCAPVAGKKSRVRGKFYEGAAGRPGLLLCSRLRHRRGFIHGFLWLRFAHSGLSDISLRLYPRFIGVLFGVVGVAFIVKNFTLVLAPAYSWDLLLIPAPITILVLTVWFLAKGVDVDKWNERVSGMRPVMK